GTRRTAPRRCGCPSRGWTRSGAGSPCTGCRRSAPIRPGPGSGRSWGGGGTAEPVLRWESHLAQVKRLEAGEGTGYGRRYVAEEETWIGIVPVGYADGVRLELTRSRVV